MADIIQIRRDVASAWTSANPILADGEFGYEKDTGRVKVGNAVDHWNTLDYSFEDFSDNYKANIVLIGTINGSNATFTTPDNFIPETVTVLVNGLGQKKVRDFNTSGTNTIIFTDSPTVGETLLTNYFTQ